MHQFSASQNETSQQRRSSEPMTLGQAASQICWQGSDSPIMSATISQAVAFLQACMQPPMSICSTPPRLQGPTEWWHSPPPPVVSLVVLPSEVDEASEVEPELEPPDDDDDDEPPDVEPAEPDESLDDPVEAPVDPALPAVTEAPPVDPAADVVPSLPPASSPPEQAPRPTTSAVLQTRRPRY